MGIIDTNYKNRILEIQLARIRRKQESNLEPKVLKEGDVPGASFYLNF